MDELSLRKTLVFEGMIRTLLSTTHILGPLTFDAYDELKMNREMCLLSLGLNIHRATVQFLTRAFSFWLIVAN